MRLWHYKLVPQLDRQHLLGQHRECCALRGLGWDRKHATVDYVFRYSPKYLIAYHLEVIAEMEKRGYHVDPLWKNIHYRGKLCKPLADDETEWQLNDVQDHCHEHDDAYLAFCVRLLKNRGINVSVEQ
jgi:uncharacterized protein (TIGR02328 family)